MSDSDTNLEIRNLTVYVTPDEAIELASHFQYLAKHPEAHHSHSQSADGTREITVAVYTPTNIDQFDERSRELIADDWKRASPGHRILADYRTLVGKFWSRFRK